MANQSIKRNSKKHTRARTVKNRYSHLPSDSLEQSSSDIMVQPSQDYEEEWYSHKDPMPENDYPILDQLSSFSQEEKEDMFSQLEEQIENKKNLLMSKRNFFNTYAQENPYLQEVATQYDTIYTALLNEKRKEFIALNALQEYLLYLINNNIVIDKEIDAVRKEQQHILEEMHRLRAQVHYAW